MVILLSLVGKRTEGSLFPRSLARSLALMKNSSGESVGVVKLKSIL